MDVLRVLSLGAGVQSSTLALMAARGEIEPVHHAIFADTQTEPRKVYDWLDWLEAEIQRCPHPFPVHRVTKGDLYSDSLRVRTSKKSNNKYLSAKIPAFILAPDGTRGMFGRSCTADYKVSMIERKVKQLLGIKRFNERLPVMVHQLIGISMDEADRQKPSKHSVIKNVWPLLDLDMSRHDCLMWMRSRNYPEPPKSACIFCPFHSDAMWEEIKADKEEWAKVVWFERQLQAGAKADDVTRGVPYLHRDCVPIDEVVFKPKTNLKMYQRTLFGNECSGMCGV
jgi:hypothetical protein